MAGCSQATPCCSKAATSCSPHTDQTTWNCSNSGSKARNVNSSFCQNNDIHSQIPSSLLRTWLSLLFSPVKHTNYIISLPILWTVYLTVFEKCNHIELKLDKHPNTWQNRQARETGTSVALLRCQAHLFEHLTWNSHSLSTLLPMQNSLKCYRLPI